MRIFTHAPPEARTVSIVLADDRTHVCCEQWGAVHIAVMPHRCWAGLEAPLIGDPIVATIAATVAAVAMYASSSTSSSTRISFTATAGASVVARLQALATHPHLARRALRLGTLPGVVGGVATYAAAPSSQRFSVRPSSSCVSCLKTEVAVAGIAIGGIINE